MCTLASQYETDDTLFDCSAALFDYKQPDNRSIQRVNTTQDITNQSTVKHSNCSLTPLWMNHKVTDWLFIHTRRQAAFVTTVLTDEIIFLQRNYDSVLK